jgi:hypothetical protein
VISSSSPALLKFAVEVKVPPLSLSLEPDDIEVLLLTISEPPLPRVSVPPLSVSE